MKDMILPTTPVAVEKEEPTVLIIYGATKIGKTGILADLPNNLIMDLERGAETYECLRIRVDSYSQFKSFASKLAEGHPYQYGTLDTIDRLVEWIESAVVLEWNEGQKKVKEPVYVRVYSEIPYGKGYDMVRLEMRKWINFFRKTFPKFIMVGHLKRTIIGETTIEVKEDNLDLVGKLRNMVCADADAIAFAFRSKDKEDDKPVLKFSFIASENSAAGSRRLKKLRGRVLTMSKLIDEENDIYENYWGQIYDTEDEKTGN